MLRSLPSDPPCPGCGRRYAIKFMKPHHQKPTYFCDPSREIGGCGREFDAK